MSNNDLKTKAEELEALLAVEVVEPSTTPVIDESYLLATGNVDSPEKIAALEHDEILPELVRSIVEYAILRAPSNAGADSIGEAIGTGVFAAANQLKLDDKKLVEAVDNFLNDLHDSVFRTLAGDQSMRRHKLLCLEMAGLVLEYGDSGYSPSAVTNGIGDLSPSGDAVEDERLRVYMVKKAYDDSRARDRRVKRLRKLARMDFKMVGGVTPVGFYGGAGSGGGGARPTSMGNRT